MPKFTFKCPKSYCELRPTDAGAFCDDCGKEVTHLDKMNILSRKYWLWKNSRQKPCVRFTEKPSGFRIAVTIIATFCNFNLAAANPNELHIRSPEKRPSSVLNPEENAEWNNFPMPYIGILVSYYRPFYTRIITAPILRWYYRQVNSPVLISTSTICEGKTNDTAQICPV